jgi:hypothetical protein
VLRLALLWCIYNLIYIQFISRIERMDLICRFSIFSIYNFLVQYVPARIYMTGNSTKRQACYPKKQNNIEQISSRWRFQAISSIIFWLYSSHSVSWIIFFAFFIIQFFNDWFARDFTSCFVVFFFFGNYLELCRFNKLIKFILVFFLSIFLIDNSSQIHDSTSSTFVWL